MLFEGGHATVFDDCCKIATMADALHVAPSALVFRLNSFSGAALLSHRHGRARGVFTAREWIVAQHLLKRGTNSSFCFGRWRG